MPGSVFEVLQRCHRWINRPRERIQDSRLAITVEANPEEFKAASGGATAGTTSQEILPINAGRKFATVSNNGAEALYLALGKDAVVGQGIRLNSGESFRIDQTYLYKGAVFAITETGSVQVGVAEGGIDLEGFTKVYTAQTPVSFSETLDRDWTALADLSLGSWEYALQHFVLHTDDLGSAELSVRVVRMAGDEEQADLFTVAGPGVQKLTLMDMFGDESIYGDTIRIEAKGNLAGIGVKGEYDYLELGRLIENSAEIEIFREQPVKVGNPLVDTNEVVLLSLNESDKHYDLHSFMVNSADPGGEVITITLRQNVGGVMSDHASFEIESWNWSDGVSAENHTLMDMFGVGSVVSSGIELVAQSTGGSTMVQFEAVYATATSSMTEETNDWVYKEQPAVPFTANVGTTDVDLLTLGGDGTRVALRSVVFKLTNPGVETLEVELIAMLNGAEVKVDSVVIEDDPFGYHWENYYTLVDVCGVWESFSDKIVLRARTSGGNVTVEGQYSWAVAQVDATLLNQEDLFVEEPGVAYEVVATSTPVVIVELDQEDRRYALRSLLVRSPDVGGSETLSLRLWRLVNDTETVVSTFDFGAQHLGVYLDAVDAFGDVIYGDYLKVDAVASSGAMRLEGQYRYGHAGRRLV